MPAGYMALLSVVGVALTILLLIAMLSLLCVAAQADVPIAAHGKARCTIVSQPGASPAEQYAARELAEGDDEEEQEQEQEEELRRTWEA